MKSTNKFKRILTMIVTMVITFSLLAFSAFSSNAAVYSSPYPYLKVQGHIQNRSWLSAKTVEMGTAVTVGLKGKTSKLDRIRIGIPNRPVGGGGIKINVHYAGADWTGFRKADCTNTAEVAPTGRARAIDAVQIELYGDLKKYYTIEYKVHSTKSGWSTLSKNGRTAGTPGKTGGIDLLYIRIH